MFYIGLLLWARPTENHCSERVAGATAHYTILAIHHTNLLLRPITAEIVDEVRLACFRSLGRVPDSCRSVCTESRKRLAEIQLIGFGGINGLGRTASGTTRPSSRIKRQHAPVYLDAKTTSPIEVASYSRVLIRQQVFARQRHSRVGLTIGSIST